jgi:hypothetical protein
MLPGGPGRVGRSNGFFGVGRAEVGNVGQLVAGGRVEHIEAAAALDPFAVDQSIGFQQGWIFEQGKGRGFHVHGVSPVGNV